MKRQFGTGLKIRKGKARKPYEFGSKVSPLVIHKQGLALSSQAFEKSSYDDHTLSGALAHGSKISGVSIKRAPPVSRVENWRV